MESKFRLLFVEGERLRCVREENVNATWCTIIREVLVGTPVVVS